MLGQIAVNSNTYHGYTLDEALKGSREAGFTQIELASVQGYTEHVVPGMSVEEIMQVKDKLKKYELECVGLGAHSNLMRQEGIDYLLRSIDLADKLGCKYIVTATGDAHDDEDIIEDETVLVANLAPVIEKCKQLDKVLVIETHGNNYSTGERMKALTVKLNTDRVLINYDTGNVVFYGNTQPYEDLKKSIDKVGFIHLKDKAGPNNQWNFPTIGEGDLDFNRIISILDNACYKGPISIEIEFTESGPESLDEVNESVRRSYKNLTKIIKDKGDN